jgi:two-component system, OmpR family, sensor kinase
VQVGENLAQRQSYVLAGALEGLYGLLFLMLPMTLGLVAVSWWTTAPLRRLQRNVEARAAEDVRPLPDDDLPRETVPLVRAFNAMLERAAQAREAQQRFIADAAHELRTPMAALRVQAQVVLRADNDAERNETLQELIAGIDRNTRMAEQLLELARVDSRQLHAGVNLATFDLRELAEAAVQQTRSLAARRQVAVHCGFEPALVRSDPAMLGVAVRNLLDNAIRYSPPGSRVELTTATAGAGVSLCVQDQGPGLSPEEVQRALEPFVRLTNGHETGSGLGLSIVKRVCTLLGHRLLLRSPAMGGGLHASIGFAAAPRERNASE